MPADRAAPGTVTIGITTMNRPDFCAELLTQIGGDEDVHAVLDEVIVAEQGTKKVADDAALPRPREPPCGGKLRLIEQGNMGGSGGYARSQLETLEAGRSTYMMCMDDDVVCEPESIVRAVTFGDLCRQPDDRRRPHVQPVRQVAAAQLRRDHQPLPLLVDVAAHGPVRLGLRRAQPAQRRWLHRRIDVDFNGWFMCLIPTEVLRTVGLSLPLFIKWDDSEFGVRAGEAGFPTVTLPGTAVWHVPWTDKNDALDWQSYFHQRNRTIAALLHSPYEHGGRVIRESFNHQVKHLFSHAVLHRRAAAPRPRGRAGRPRAAARRPGSRSCPSCRRCASSTPTRRPRPTPRRSRRSAARSRPSAARTPPSPRARSGSCSRPRPAPSARRGPPRELAARHPEARLAALDAKWWMIAQFDSVVVSMPDGASASWYHRDKDEFRDLLRRTVEIHQRLHREWPGLARRYRQALPDIVSPEQWAKTFESSSQSKEES